MGPLWTYVTERLDGVFSVDPALIPAVRTVQDAHEFCLAFHGERRRRDWRGDHRQHSPVR